MTSPGFEPRALGARGCYLTHHSGYGLIQLYSWQRLEGRLERSGSVSLPRQWGNVTVTVTTGHRAHLEPVKPGDFSLLAQIEPSGGLF